MSEARISLQKYDINDPRARVLRRFQQSERSLKFPIPATRILASDRSVEFALVHIFDSLKSSLFYSMTSSPPHEIFYVLRTLT